MSGQLLALRRALLVGARLGLLCGAAACAAAAATEPARWERLTEPVFHTFGQGRVLPNEVVYTMAQDARGFLWIGTVSGLARWDGYRAQAYRPGPPSAGALPDGWIQALRTDPLGQLWVGTSGGGLARHDAVHDRFQTIGAGPQGLSHVNVHALQPDGEGRMWVGTDGGLDRIELRTLAVTRHADAGAVLEGLPRVRVTALTRDRGGRLWVGTEAGLYRQRAAAAGFEPVAMPTPRAVAVNTLHEDARGHLWIGTAQQGAFVVRAGDPGAAPAQAVQVQPWQGAGLAGDDVTSICEVRPGVLWFATLGRGVLELDLGGDAALAEPQAWRARRLRHAPGSAESLANDTVREIFRDRAGWLWLATDRGISRHDPAQRAVRSMFGLNLPEASGHASGDAPGGSGRGNTEVSWILPAPDGRLWLGTHKQGVVVLDPASGALQALRPDPRRPGQALPQDIVLAIADGPEGERYIATKRGLYRASADARQVRRVAIPGRDPAAGVWALWRQGPTLWIGGALDGLWSLDLRSGQARQRSAQAMPPAWRLSDDRVTVIAPAPQGALWIGTRHGLNRFDPDRGVLARWTPGTDAGPTAAAEGTAPAREARTGLRAGFVTALHTDARGRLWVGSFGGGLALVEQPLAEAPALRHLSTAEGLPDENINALLDDGQGRLWASTDNGLAVIDQASLAVRALGPAEGVVFPVYWTGSAARTAQGELLFGGAGGMTIVQPQALRADAPLPPVVVSGLQVDGHARPAAAAMAGQPIVIEPGSAGLSVEFAALDYSDPTRLRYATRLVGVDRDWIEADAQHRLVAYTHLVPGDYTLQLRGSNRLGQWNPQPLELRLQVLPAWYQTWWARALALGALAVIVLGALQLRTRRLRAQQAWLEHSVEQRTAELHAVTQRLAEQGRALEQASLTDPLTRLHNRRYLTQRMAARQGEADGPAGAPIALLLVDIDHFKHINDSHGHAVGDAVLVEVARRLRQRLRPGDDLVRWGGEEFLLVAGGCDAGGAERLAETLRAAIHDEPVDVGGTPALRLSVSIGFACLPFLSQAPQALDWEAVLALADVALYAAKRSGRNGWLGLLPGAAARAEGLVQRALDDPRACVATGELQVRCSAVPAAAIVALRGH